MALIPVREVDVLEEFDECEEVEPKPWVDEEEPVKGSTERPPVETAYSPNVWLEVLYNEERLAAAADMPTCDTKVGEGAKWTCAVPGAPPVGLTWSILATSAIAGSSTCIRAEPSSMGARAMGRSSSWLTSIPFVTAVGFVAEVALGMRCAPPRTPKRAPKVVVALRFVAAEDDPLADANADMAPAASACAMGDGVETASGLAPASFVRVAREEGVDKDRTFVALVLGLNWVEDI